jgi:hypothetical protein
MGKPDAGPVPAEPDAGAVPAVYLPAVYTAFSGPESLEGRRLGRSEGPIAQTAAVGQGESQYRALDGEGRVSRKHGEYGGFLAHHGGCAGHPGGGEFAGRQVISLI